MKAQVILDRHLAVVSLRNGKLLILQLSTVLNPATPTTEFQFFTIHGKDAVTDFAVENINVNRKRKSSDSQENIPKISIVLLTCGRDGFLNRFEIIGRSYTNDDDSIASISEWEISRTYRSKVSKGWLEQIMVRDHEILVCGFYDKSFFVYNDTKRFRYFEIPCSGAHRKWEFKLPESKNMAESVFGFARNDGACFVSQPKVVDPFQDFQLQPSFHGSECRTICFTSINQHPLLITGGEDSILRFHTFSVTHKGLHKSILGLKRHSSAILSIAILTINNHTNLLFTAGARDQLISWSLHGSIDANQDLSINCIELCHAPARGVGDNRIMSIAPFQICSRFFVCAGLSNGILRVWEYDTINHSFIFSHENTHHDRCILKLSSINLNENVCVIISAATDGRILMWKFDGHLSDSPCLVYQAHQSGINALSATLLDTSFMIATGGDDGAVSLIKVSVETELAICATGKVVDAHSANVTGILLSPLTLISASIDQLICIWNIDTTSPDVNGISRLTLNKVKKFGTSCADICDIGREVIEGHDYIAVCGSGCEVISI